MSGGYKRHVGNNIRFQWAQMSLGTIVGGTSVVGHKLRWHK